MQQYAEQNLLTNVTFWGTQKLSDIPRCMSQNDVLVLPSLHDGWGAVVNEALHQGLYVVCSTDCGAKELLVNERLGKIFRTNDVAALTDCLLYCKENKERLNMDKSYRKEWARKCISGKVVAKYMVDCLEGADVCAPWERV